MKVLILAGGSGTRLWPLSRKNFPKQFLKIGDDKSLLQHTVERVKDIVNDEDILVITNKDYKFHIKTELKNIPEENIILEPEAKNTAPAIALAIKYCLDKLHCSEDETILVLPSDHIIKPKEKFKNYIKAAVDLANYYIITFGIKPEKPETGYGYIKIGEKIKDTFFKVDKFTEKPDFETAKKYIEDGSYYWNSGMFMFIIKTIKEEFEKYSPEISKIFSKTFEDAINSFYSIPNISIDYEIIEKSDKVITTPLDIKWSDVGSWDSLAEILEKDDFGNVKVGDTLTFDTKNSFIIGDKRVIATIGLEDIIVVETDDAILIAKKGETQKVKNIVEHLSKKGRKEATEHTTVYRPWGSYTVLEVDQRYKIKKIVVNPGQKLSLQMHHHRSEHWVVVKGTAKVTIGDKEIFLHENESTYVPKSTPHRLENVGKIPLEIIEVQNGEYIEEDDIIRFDDAYGRQ